MEDIGLALAEDLDSAFPLVVDHMGKRLYWGLRRMSADHQEAEDLTQETFIRAYKALESYDRGRLREMRLEPWLWTIALNLGRNHVRDRARRPTYVPLQDTGRDDPEVTDGPAWDRRLRSLNRHQRTAVVLRHLVGMGTSEIAEATGRPEGTVKADIHRGLAKLRIVMEDEK
ncbi:MAG: RNA polymerase sigma factor [Acidimicrobiia bacterium]